MSNESTINFEEAELMKLAEWKAFHEEIASVRELEEKTRPYYVEQSKEILDLVGVWESQVNAGVALFVDGEVPMEMRGEALNAEITLQNTLAEVAKKVTALSELILEQCENLMFLNTPEAAERRSILMEIIAKHLHGLYVD